VVVHTRCTIPFFHRRSLYFNIAFYTESDYYVTSSIAGILNSSLILLRCQRKRQSGLRLAFYLDELMTNLLKSCTNIKKKLKETTRLYRRLPIVDSNLWIRWQPNKRNFIVHWTIHNSSTKIITIKFTLTIVESRIDARSYKNDHLQELTIGREFLQHPLLQLGMQSEDTWGCQ
jgi:hypothetical protein